MSEGRFFSLVRVILDYLLLFLDYYVIFHMYWNTVDIAVLRQGGTGFFIIIFRDLLHRIYKHSRHQVKFPYYIGQERRTSPLSTSVYI